MARPETTRPGRVSQVSVTTVSRSQLLLPEIRSLSIATVLAAIVTIAGGLLFLSSDLPEQPGEALYYPASELRFAFGSGKFSENRMHVDVFANGYALLSSGPVNLQADKLRVLSYDWLPPTLPLEAAFFWRRSDDAQNVMRTEISSPGINLIDLSTEPEWHGEITEFGFLLAGAEGESVELGDTLLMPDSLKTRLQLTWRAWSLFEAWSQKSINFIYGGDYRQIVALPLLVVAWLLCTLLFLWLILLLGKKADTRQLLGLASMLFLVAWVLLDIRWSVNNIKQAHFSWSTKWQVNEQQRLNNELDGDIYQYVQRLKATVLGDKPARILIIGDENAMDYYLLRTKYHLLPHSALVTKRIAKELKPGSIDFVVHFGQPASIINTPGWNRAWQQSLVQVDSGQWGVVYKTR
jgi:hypothetical protein